jgi:hypothetical protein
MDLCSASAHTTVTRGRDAHWLLLLLYITCYTDISHPRTAVLGFLYIGRFKLHFKVSA